MVQDSNASCLDVALDVLLAFADRYAKASEHSTELAPVVVAKGLSGRPGTISRAEAVLLKLMEVRSTTKRIDRALVVLNRRGFLGEIG